MTDSEYIQEYLKTLTDIEKVAYNTAIDILGSSFNILRCTHYINWRSQQE